MSDSQEQSLDENVVFLPASEASADFLHSEREREAVERLLQDGPEAFYSSAEQAGCFLSPEEVSQITGWAQSFGCSPPQAQRDDGGGGGGDDDDDDDFCSTYFPCETDMPTPNLELGWPDRDPWLQQGSVAVHTSPPAEGQPGVREVIRRHLQAASQLVAVVTDRLTDGLVISDLHHVASRGVPIYIILNRRTRQESSTLSRLRHPNMRVRVLGGKSFCTRSGRMVVGEMKNNFVLVDLETVIHGSYSLTWTDAHLHRQLVTVLSGPAVEAFDREFRILYAASSPASERRRAAGGHAGVALQLKDRSDPGFHKALCTEAINPPPPPSDCFLDWEAMGVVQRDGGGFSEGPLHPHGDILVQRVQLGGQHTPVWDGLTCREEPGVESRRIYENSQKYTRSRLPEPPAARAANPDRMQRIEQRIKMAAMTRLSNEPNNHFHEWSPPRAENQAGDPPLLFSARRRERWRTAGVPEGGGGLEEGGGGLEEGGGGLENSPSSRKPVVAPLPHADSFSSLSDIMRRIQLRTAAAPNRGTSSERTRSMMDLSRPEPEPSSPDRVPPVPRFKTSFEPDPMTPALALMKKRNDHVKASLFGPPTTAVARERPRSSSFALKLDWRTRRDGDDA